MKNNRLRKIMTLFLALTMVLTSVSFLVFAENEDPSGGNGNDTYYDNENGGDQNGSGDGNGGDQNGGDQNGSDQNGAGDDNGGDQNGGDQNGSDQNGGDQNGGDNTGGDNTGDPVDPPADDPVVAPEAPTGYSVSCSGKTATVTWDKVEGVSYKARIYLDTPGDWVDLGEKNSYTKTIEYGKTYTYEVIAYNEGGESDPVGDTFSKNNTISAPTITSLSVPIQGIADGEGQRKKYVKADNLITIKWSAPAEAVSKYAIVRSDGKIVANNIASTARSHQFRGAAGTYSYAVRAYSAADTADYADSAAKSAGKVIAYLEKVHKTWYWNATMDKATTLYKKGTGSAKIKTIAKGTKGKIIATYPKRPKKWNKPSRVQIQLYDSNGKLTNTKGWVKYSVISASPIIDTKRDYPVSVKEAFVKNYSSSTKYLIWVNGYTQRINIFQGKKGSWKLISTNRVTLGNFYQPVSTGKKILKNKKGTVYMLDDKGRPYYFKYSRTFGGSGYFHTRSYWANGKAKNKVTYRPSTKGCIRQYTDDAKFLYGLPKGTQILFY